MIRDPVRLAILGAAKIAPRVALALPSHVSVVGIASRDLARATAFAEQYHIGRVYSSYHEALRDRDVDAVYIATPCSEHVPWTLAALGAGKHALVEKPFALSRADAEQAVRLAAEGGRVLMEAHHSVFHPLTIPFQEAVSRLGRLSEVEVVFDAPIREESDIRLNPMLGAGVMLDFGGYLLSWLEWVRRASDQSRASRAWGLRFLSADATCRPDQIDRTFWAELECLGAPERFPARLRASMDPDCLFQARIVVEGAGGRVHFENPLALQGSFLEQPDHTRTVARGPTTYEGQMRAFYHAVRHGQVLPHAADDILALAGLIDSAYAQSGLSGRDAVAGRNRRPNPSSPSD